MSFKEDKENFEIDRQLKEALLNLSGMSDEEIMEYLDINEDGRHMDMWDNILLSLDPMKTVKFKFIYALILIHHMMQGNTFLSFGAVIGVSDDRLWDWAKRIPMFKKAKELATVFARYNWEKKLNDSASGKSKGNAISILFGLKNYYPDDFKDRKEVEHSGHVYMVDTGIDREDSTIEDVDYREINNSHDQEGQAAIEYDHSTGKVGHFDPLASLGEDKETVKKQEKITQEEDDDDLL